MVRLIEKFASTLSGNQKQSIAALINREIADGSVVTFEDFKSRLAELTNSTLSVTSLFNFEHQSALGKVSSFIFNNWMHLLELDTQVLYRETDRLNDLVVQHDLLFKKKIRDIIDSASDLDSQVTNYEALHASSDYTSGQYNTFDSVGSAMVSSTDENYSSLVLDPRTQNILSDSFFNTVDIAREGLVLPLVKAETAIIQSVYIVEGISTTTSDLDIEPTDNELSNILVEDDGQYWVKSILRLSEDYAGNPQAPLVEGALVKIGIKLGGAQEINSLTIVPILDNAVELTSISYIDAIDGQEYMLVSQPSVLVDRTVFSTSKVVTQELFLSFTIKTYSELTDFYYSEDASSTAQDFRDAVKAGTGYLTGTSDAAILYTKGYYYSLLIDFLKIEKVTYREYGLFVSQPLVSTSYVSQLIMKATVARSTDTSGNYTDLLEFYVAKYNYDSSGLFVSLEYMPVVIDGDPITHEVILFKDSLDKLRFYPVLDTVQLYRNYSLMTLGTDYTLSVNGIDYRSDLATLLADAPVGPPYSLSVRLVDYNVYDLYMASYTPETAIGSIPIYLNGTGTAEFTGRFVQFNKLADEAIAYSKLYSVIVLRSLDYSTLRSTPIVYDYQLGIVEA